MDQQQTHQQLQQPSAAFAGASWFAFLTGAIAFLIGYVTPIWY